MPPLVRWQSEPAQPAEGDDQRGEQQPAQRHHRPEGVGVLHPGHTADIDPEQAGDEGSAATDDSQVDSDTSADADD